MMHPHLNRHPIVVALLFAVLFVASSVALPAPFIRLSYEHVTGLMVINDGSGPSDVSARLNGSTLVSVVGRGIPDSTKALSLPGSSTTPSTTMGHLVFTNASVLDLRPRFSEFTITAWVRLRRTDNIQTIWARGNELATAQAVVVTARPGGACGASVGGSVITTATGILELNTWTMLTITNRMTPGGVWEFSLFANDVFLGSSRSGTSKSTDRFMIGARPTSTGAISYPMTGYVDDFQYFAVAFDNSQVQELYRAALHISSSPTPSETPSGTLSAAATASITASTSATITPPPTSSGTASVSTSESQTETKTSSFTGSATSSQTASQSSTGSTSASPSVSESPTASHSDSATVTISHSISPSSSSTESSSRSAASTPSSSSSSTPSASGSKTESASSSVTISVSVTASETPSSSASISFSSTPSVTASTSRPPSLSASLSGTSAPTGSSSSTVSITPSRSLNSSPSRTATCSAPASPTADPYYSSDYLLFPFDSMVGSKIPDHSLNAMTATPHGAFTLSGTNARYGSSAAVFDGTNAYLAVDSPSHGMSTGDFTTELWVRTVDGCVHCMVLASSTGSFQLYFLTSNVMQLWLSTVSYNYDIVYGLDVALYVAPLEWHHVVIGREGPLFTTFFDGLRVAQLTSSSSIEDSALLFGAMNNAYYFRGSIDDFRLTQGLARYSSSLQSFCAPGPLPFPDIPSRSSTASNTASITASRSTSPTASITSTVSFTATISVSPSLSRSVSMTASHSVGASVSPSSTCAPPSSGPDPNFSNVFLEFTFNELLGNGKVQDYSNNAFTATPAGSFAISTSVAKYGAGSAYFDGSTSGLSVDTSSHGMSSGDFTTEMWLRIVDGCQNCMVLSSGTTLQLFFLTPNVLRIWLSTSGNAYDIANANLVGDGLDNNAWHHVVFQRSGTLFSTFFNGQPSGTFTSSATFPDGVLTFGMMSNQYRYRGYIDDYRTTKFVARYPTAFCPPGTLPIAATPTPTLTPTPSPSLNVDPYANNVFISYSFDTISSNRIPDLSKNGYYATAEAGFLLSTSTFKNGGSAASFSGSTLVVASVASNGVSTGDFTIELWARTIDGCSTCMLLSSAPGSLQIYFDAANSLKIWVSSSGTTYDIASGVAITSAFTQNVWHHVAVTRSGNYFRTFFDGSFTTIFASSQSIGNGAYYLGRYSQSGGYFFRGFIDDFRVTSSVARYVTPYTVPGATPFSYSGPDSSYNNVYILHTFDALVSGKVPDLGRNGYSATPDSGFALSSTIYKNGGSAANFGGSTGLVSSAVSTGVPIGDFTIEFWARSIDGCSSCMIMSSSPGAIQVYFDAANSLKLWISSTSTTYGIANAVSITSNFTPNVWHHVAITRSGNTFRNCFDGTVTTTFSSSATIQDGPFYLGRYSQGGYFFRGYIDDFRVSTVARYTSTYTPPGVMV